MSSCGRCHHQTIPSAEVAPLIQITESYRTHWNDLTFSVERSSGRCLVRVQDLAETKTLYTAYRSGLHAARLAAAEFAISSHCGFESRMSPERLDKELEWETYLALPRQSSVRASTAVGH